MILTNLKQIYKIVFFKETLVFENIFKFFYNSMMVLF